MIGYLSACFFKCSLWILVSFTCLLIHTTFLFFFAASSSSTLCATQNASSCVVVCLALLNSCYNFLSTSIWIVLASFYLGSTISLFSSSLFYFLWCWCKVSSIPSLVQLCDSLATLSRFSWIVLSLASFRDCSNYIWWADKGQWSSLFSFSLVDMRMVKSSFYPSVNSSELWGFSFKLSLLVDQSMILDLATTLWVPTRNIVPLPDEDVTLVNLATC